jgi:hypothetical protein
MLVFSIRMAASYWSKVTSFPLSVRNFSSRKLPSLRAEMVALSLRFSQATTIFYAPPAKSSLRVLTSKGQTRDLDASRGLLSLAILVKPIEEDLVVTDRQELRSSLFQRIIKIIQGPGGVTSLGCF